MITISGFMKTISGTTKNFVIVGVAIEFVPRPIFFCCEKKNMSKIHKAICQSSAIVLSFFSTNRLINEIIYQLLSINIFY